MRDVFYNVTSPALSGCAGIGHVLDGYTYGSVVGVADWTGDGNDDYFMVSGSTLHVRPALGGEMGSLVDTGIPVSSGCVLIRTDGNGDDLDDIGCLYPGSGLTLYYHNATATVPDLAAHFVDGFGITHSPTYVSIQRDNYSPYSNAVYPYRDVTSDRVVVGQVTASDGIGGTYVTQYEYFGALINLQGRGFAGFDKIEAVDSRSGIKRVQKFKREFPYSGMAYEVSVYQPDGTTLISSKIITAAHHTLDSAAYNERFFPYVASSIEDAYEVGGARDGDWITRTEVSNSYDTWGNLTASTSIVTDKDGSSNQYNQSWTRSSSISFSPNITYWCLGLPTASSTSSSTTVSGEGSVTISKSFTPDYANCRMSAEVLEPSYYPRRVETAYSYDVFGNLSSVAVTGYNPDSSAMSTRTSSITWGSPNGATGGTGQFPVSETNAAGHTTTRTFHPAFGSLVTEVDPNSIVVASNDYDAFGRITRSIRADGTATRYTHAACATYGCENGDPSSGATGINKMIVIASEHDTADSQIRDSWTYLDQLDRPIVQKAKTLVLRRSAG